MNNDFIRKFGKPDQHFDSGNVGPYVLLRNKQPEDHHLDYAIRYGHPNNIVPNYHHLKSHHVDSLIQRMKNMNIVPTTNLIELGMHDKLTTKHIDDLMKDTSKDFHREISNFPKLHQSLVEYGHIPNHYKSMDDIELKIPSDNDVEHITNGGNGYAIRRLAKNKNLSSGQIDKIIDNTNTFHHLGTIAKHPKLQPHHVNKLIDNANNDESQIISALTSNTGVLQPHHIDRLIENPKNHGYLWFGNIHMTNEQKDRIK